MILYSLYIIAELSNCVKYGIYSNHWSRLKFLPSSEEHYKRLRPIISVQTHKHIPGGPVVQQLSTGDCPSHSMKKYLKNIHFSHN